MIAARKFLLFSLILASMAGCSPSSSSSAPLPSSDITPSSDPSSSQDSPSISFSEVKEVSIYSPDPENDYAPKLYGTITCGFSPYYENEEAYFSLEDVLGEVSESINLSTPFAKTVSGGIATYHGGNGYDVSFSVDASNDVITFSDYPSYISLKTSFEGDFGWAMGINRLSYIEGSSKYVSGGETVFDLGHYDIDIVAHDGGIYIPGAIARYIFLDVHGISLIYNGNAVYRPSSHDDIYSGGALTAFGEAYYDSPLSKVAEKNANSAKLHGDETMFYLDHYYGFKDDEKYMGGLFSSYLKEHYPEEYSLFYSRKKDDGEKVYEWLLHAYFDDLHSTAPANMGSLYAGHEFANQYGSTPRYNAYLNRYLELFTLRQETLGIEGDAGGGSLDEMLSIEGDMAVIRFDVFLRDSGVITSGNSSYYRQHMYEDLYSLFAYSFLTLEGKGVKKVVIDLTLNGGGYTEACLEALSFLRDEVTSSLYYAMNGSSSDISFTGMFPGERIRSYADEYDFYVMTSLCTFSSANLMAAMAKNAGIKIIGERSGGGACMVGFFYTPEGQAARISSPIRLPITSGKAHIDGGISPDIELDASYFYDLPKLSAKLDEA